MKRINVILEKAKDGRIWAYTPDVEKAAINGSGETIDEAIEDFKEALEETKLAFNDMGEPVPDEIAGEVEYNYKYDIASLFERFNMINLGQFAEFIDMNKSLLRKYKSGLATASEKQKERIKDGLQRLGKELSEIKV